MCKCCEGMNRRTFLGASMAAAVGASLMATGTADAAGSNAWVADLWNPDRPYAPRGKTLKVQPILMYTVPRKAEERSFKSWGGVQSDEAAQAEAKRIADELDGLKNRAGFAVEFLPVALVTTPEQAAKATAADATILYPATGGGDLLKACIPPQNGLIFVRHKSGPVYYWYEALSVQYLRCDRPDFEAARAGYVPSLSVHDVVVDDPDELLWRLRVLYAIRNTQGARVLSVGGLWGKYAQDAPDIAKSKYGMDLVDVAYEDLGKRIDSALNDTSRVARANEWTDRYLSLSGTTLETERSFVVNAFVLYGLFKDLMLEHDADAFTIKSCMSTILPMAKTTACLTLSLLNDEGLLAFCESDFVVIPPGILLYHLCGYPVFMHNSTFPHNGVVTCAHCTGPRRMDGDRYEPARIVTHYESDFGAAPKVEMPKGQQVTFISPEYTKGRWVGLRGTVEDNPFYEICRSQQDVRIDGNWKKMLSEVRDSHWLMVYGDKLREIGYAADRMGIVWDDFSTQEA